MQCWDPAWGSLMQNLLSISRSVGLCIIFSLPLKCSHWGCGRCSHPPSASRGPTAPNTSVSEAPWSRRLTRTPSQRAPLSTLPPPIHRAGASGPLLLSQLWGPGALIRSSSHSPATEGGLTYLLCYSPITHGPLITLQPQETALHPSPTLPSLSVTSSFHGLFPLFGGAFPPQDLEACLSAWLPDIATTFT